MKIKIDFKRFRSITVPFIVSFPFLLFIALIQNLAVARAGDQVGTITQLEGTVKIFSNPSKTLQKGDSANHALFEGEYYEVNPAEIGSKLEKGNILRTAPRAKVRLVFPNGDQFNVGSGTAYRVSWDKDSAEAHTQVSLMYGKLRGIVEKGGPRSHLQIRTKTAVMGVRGTDFFIAEGGADGGTEVSIIRGKVEVSAPTPQAKPIQIGAGFSAAIAGEPTLPTQSTAAMKKNRMETKPAAMSPMIELRKTTQEEFAGIQKSSTLTSKTSAASATPETKKEIQLLEKKAEVTTLKDIQKSDKKLYALIEKQHVKSVDDLNKAAVQTLFKEAPKAPPHHKPYKSELENLENGAYQHYFKDFD